MIRFETGAGRERAERERGAEEDREVGGREESL